MLVPLITTTTTYFYHYSNNSISCEKLIPLFRGDITLVIVMVTFLLFLSSSTLEKKGDESLDINNCIIQLWIKSEKDSQTYNLEYSLYEKSSRL